MKKNDLIRNQNGIYRVLDITEQEVLIIDCLRQTMPVRGKEIGEKER